MAAETALPGCTGRFSAVRKPQMRVFGAKPPPVQPPQGRSGKFRTHFSPVMTGAANHQIREAQKRRKPLHVPLQTPIPSHVAAEHPLGQVIPDLPNRRCASPRRSSRWRKSGSSSRPEPSQAPPRQSAGCSPPRKPVLHHRVAQVAERLNAVNAQHHRQRMRLLPLAAALRTRRRNAGFQTLPGDQAVHPLRKDLAALLALLAIALEAGKGQLPKALHVVIPQTKGVTRKQQARTGCAMQRPKIRLYSEVP